MNIDFAIIGSSPKAALIATMLAKTHGKNTILISHFPHKFRPQHGFDISVAPIMRAKTWQILKNNISTTVDFLSKTSTTKTIERIDPIFASTNHDGDTALSYMRNTASGFGFNIEKQAISENFISSYKFHDAIRLLRRPFFASLNQRLKDCNVKLLSPKETKLRNRKDNIDIISKEGNFSAKQVILVDGRALQDHLLETDISNHFIQSPFFGFLSEPIKKQKNQIIFNLDNGLIIHQRENGALDCLTPKNQHSLEQQVCLMLEDKQTIRLAGKTQFIKLKSLDGAPIFGKIARSRYIAICNFGTTGLFQTPAIAAMLADSANEFEKQYFNALAPSSKKYRRKNISEFSPKTQGHAVLKRSSK